VSREFESGSDTASPPITSSRSAPWLHESTPQPTEHPKSDRH
jgi:hypothetical protein